MNTKEVIAKVAPFTWAASGIAWDGCHKIYVLGDEEQMDQMREYGYDPLISSVEMDSDQMAAQVAAWFEASCGLRFVSACKTEADGGTEFLSVIEQFEDEEEEL